MTNITTIEKHFKKGYPDYDIEIEQGQTVKAENAEFFVQSTLLCLKHNPGKERYKTYYDKLLSYYNKSK